MGLRRALFQVHLWLGVGVGLYVLVICLSGSVIVFRREMDLAFCQIVVPAEPAIAQTAPAPEPTRPRTVICEPAWVTSIADFHDRLLFGREGLMVNGVGAIIVTLMCLSGAVIWWPGKGRWWRRMSLQRGVGWRRFTWDLHNVLGFWVFLLVVLWTVSAIYFGFPMLFQALGDDALALLARLHFGRTFGFPVKVIWALLGLAPCVLFITGVVMWWNRVVRRHRASG